VRTRERITRLEPPRAAGARRDATLEYEFRGPVAALGLVRGRRLQSLEQVAGGPTRYRTSERLRGALSALVPASALRDGFERHAPPRGGARAAPRRPPRRPGLGAPAAALADQGPPPRRAAPSATCPSPRKRSCSVHALQDRRDPHARPDALRREAVAGPAAPQLHRDRGDEARSGGAERVADRDRAAVHVHLRGRDPPLAQRRDHLGGEGLVELDAVDLRGLDARGPERLARRDGPAHAPQLRLHAAAPAP